MPKTLRSPNGHGVKKKGSKPVLPPPARAWDLQPGETAKGFEYFNRYLEMGFSRSMEKVAKTLGFTRNAIERYCSKNKWVERARAYDAYMSTSKIEGTEDIRAKLTQQHLALFGNIRNGIAAHVQIMMRKLSESMGPNGPKIEGFENLSIHDQMIALEPFIKHLPKLVQMERLLLGLPTDIMDIDLTANLEAERKEFSDYVNGQTPDRLIEIMQRSERRFRIVK